MTGHREGRVQLQLSQQMPRAAVRQHRASCPVKSKGPDGSRLCQAEDNHCYPTPTPPVRLPSCRDSRELRAAKSQLPAASGKVLLSTPPQGSSLQFTLAVTAPVCAKGRIDTDGHSPQMSRIPWSKLSQRNPVSSTHLGWKTQAEFLTSS